MRYQSDYKSCLQQGTERKYQVREHIEATGYVFLEFMPVGTQTRVRKMGKSLSSDFDRGSDLRKDYIYYDYSKEKKEHYDIFLRFSQNTSKRIIPCIFGIVTSKELYALKISNLR